MKLEGIMYEDFNHKKIVILSSKMHPQKEACLVLASLSQSAQVAGCKPCQFPQRSASVSPQPVCGDALPV